MGGKRHGGQKAWGAKGQGAKGRGAKDRGAKDRGAKDRGAKVLSPVLPHIVETRDQNSKFPGGCPALFERIFFVHRGQKSYTPTTFGMLWTTPGARCVKHASS